MAKFGASAPSQVRADWKLDKDDVTANYGIQLVHQCPEKTINCADTTNKVVELDNSCPTMTVKRAGRL